MTRILCVIVLYKIGIQDCATLQTLEAARQEASVCNLDLRIFLFDNTPGAPPPLNLLPWEQYEASAKNGGLSVAYNRALEIARSEGYDWLITLDQDSRLPANYLVRMAEIAETFADDNSVVAAVPQLSDQGRLLSPVSVGKVRVSPLPKGFTGFSHQEIHAYNSGSMLRVSALVKWGGFSQQFWLDYLDAWLYTQVAREGKRVFVAGDLQIEHELSILDAKNRLSSGRFRNYLRAESAYVDQYRGALEGWLLNVRLVIRWLRHWKQGADASFLSAVWSCLKDRIVHSKKYRIAEWTREMEERNADG